MTEGYRLASLLCLVLTAIISASLSSAEDVSPSQDYLLRPGDVISITVAGQPDESIPKLIIPEDGRISVYNRYVSAAGRTRAELERELRSVFSTLIKDPIVSVNLVETPYNKVYVTGAVTSPGSVDYVSGLTVRKAIARAGGLKPNAARTALLTTAHSQPVTRTIDLAALMRGDAAQDIELHPGDYLQINEATVTVTGEVTKQGDVPYRDADTVLRAVANAGGVTSRGDARNVSVRRNGREIARVDLSSQSPQAQGPEFGLEPGDTVFVPEAVIHVAGEVAKPGTYPLREADTALKALASASGPSSRANTYRAIVQRDGKTAAYVNLNRVGTSADAGDGTVGADYPLQPGDVLFVPPITSRVHVEGAVAKPGLVDIVEKERDKALDVLALAGGALSNADLKGVELRRLSNDGRYIALRLDLSPSGTPADNVILRDGDYLYVPVKRTRDTTRALVAASYVVSIISMIRTFR